MGIILEVYDNGVLHFHLLGFWTSSVTYYFKWNIMCYEWICCALKCTVWNAHSQLGLTEGAIIIYWVSLSS
jgi:hypothetical protein